MELAAIVIGFVGLADGVQSQQPKKVHRIGYFSVSNPSANSPSLGAFRQGLRELGYIEGTNFVIESPSAEKNEAARAAELVRLKVDVIVTVGSIATRSAKETTATIPIVMTQDPDPVGSGFVASLARPGGNITGLSNLNRELSGKRLELLTELIPRLSRVAVSGTSTQPGHAQALKETELAAKAFGVKLQYLDVLDPKAIEPAFRAANKGRAEALLGLGGAILNSHQTQVVELAAKSRLPAMYSVREYVEAGGTHELRREHQGLGSARHYVCGQDFERRQTRRITSGATDQVRVHRQSQSGEADRPDDPAEYVGAGRSGDSMTAVSSQRAVVSKNIGDKSMMKSILVWLLVTAILISTPAADAQQPGKIFRIGLLDTTTASNSAVRLEAFWQEIRKLGWIEEKFCHRVPIFRGEK